MKPVAFDARLWKHAGIGRYITELARGFYDTQPKPDIVFLGPKALTAEAPFSAFGCAEARSRIYGALEQIEIASLAGKFPLLHVPHFNIPLLYRGRLVVTVHDLTYLHEPGVSSRPQLAKRYAEFFLKTVAKKASAVITVSEYTRQDLLTAIPRLSADRVCVVPEAAAAVFKKGEPVRAKKSAKSRFGIDKPFILFVGTLKPHKNLPILIDAVERVRAKGLPHELVVVGRPEKSRSALSALVESKSYVRYLGELPDEALADLYAACEVFVLPSLREGFGLPVLEAMACGAPVLASNQTSLPEVGGDAAAYFDPRRIDALEGLLYNVLTDSERRNQMTLKGLEQVKKFSWRKAASDTLAVYRRALA